MQAIVAPSILSSNFADLGHECNRMLELGADWIHIDVMDGHFVPNLTLGAPVVASLRKMCSGFFDAHFMVDNPEDYVEPFAKAGANQFTFHIEATKDADALIDKIHKAGMKVGISVKPKTPIDSVFPYLSKIDMVLVMTVEPGFGGQSFMFDMLDKVRTIRQKCPKINIEVDGGVNFKTIETVSEAGANVFVAGAIFKTDDPKGMIETFHQTGNKYIKK